MARNPRAERLTRAQRRVIEREQEKQRVIEARQKPPKHFSRLMLTGGALTIVAVLAILIYAVLRSSTTATSPDVKGLADPNALHPNPSLLAVGTRAPNFTLRDVTGKPYSLHVYTGEPMVLEFFAVWCPVCHAEAPAMTRLTASYVPKGVHVWSILANGYGRDYETSGRTDLRPVDATDLSWYARTYNVHHPQLIDPTFDVTNEYGANSYPTIYILDSDGIIRYTNAGRVSYAALARSLDRVVHASISG